MVLVVDASVTGLVSPAGKLPELSVRPSNRTELKGEEPSENTSSGLPIVLIMKHDTFIMCILELVFRHELDDWSGYWDMHA